MRQVFRNTIPVDDNWHTIEVAGPVLHIATRGEDYVEVWFLDDSAVVAHDRTFRVYATGQVGVEGKHIGTAITPSGRFVWHLFEKSAGGGS